MSSNQKTITEWYLEALKWEYLNKYIWRHFPLSCLRVAKHLYLSIKNDRQVRP